MNTQDAAMVGSFMSKVYKQARDEWRGDIAKLRAELNAGGVTLAAPNGAPQQRAAPAVGQRQLREVRAIEVDAASREIVFVASDESPDRYGDIVRVADWDVTNYLRNPILAWCHDTRSPPIGQVVSLEKKGTKLLARARFLPEGTYDFADTIWRIVVAGALRAVSVGFLPTAQPNRLTDVDGNFTGFEFVGQDLLELSVVPVPANPNALQVGRELHVPPAVMAQAFVAPEMLAWQRQQWARVEALKRSAP